MDRESGRGKLQSISPNTLFSELSQSPATRATVGTDPAADAMCG